MTDTQEKKLDEITELLGEHFDSFVLVAISLDEDQTGHTMLLRSNKEQSSYETIGVLTQALFNYQRDLE